MKIVGATGLGGLWALEWAWKIFGGPDHECIYFMGSETLPSACYILSDESIILFYSTSNAYNN